MKETQKKEVSPFVAMAEGVENLPKRRIVLNKEYFAGIDSGTYGCNDKFDYEKADSKEIRIEEGKKEFAGLRILHWEDSAIGVSSEAVAVIRDSYIWGDTQYETMPLSGPPGNLLVSGNVRATLGLGNSQNYYINSTVVSRNWAVLSTDGAKPAGKGQVELSLYAYGTAAEALSGGYASYSDLFCNLYVFGSLFRAPEIGIISGSYGRVTLGTVEDGENNAELSKVLTEKDKAVRADKTLRTVVEGGRNAFMIHSVNLPPYWEFKGYSKEELPFYTAEIYAHNSIIGTDLSLDKGVVYEGAKQAYIDYTSGSSILIKSTNVDFNMDGCELYTDVLGTGYLIQTVYNNDTMFMNAVPEGETYPGIKISMSRMKVKGDISHEDYQRDFRLLLLNAEYYGAINEYSFEHWKTVCSNNGFSEFCCDEKYKTHHGIHLVMENNSIWVVTANSKLSSIRIEKGCVVKGRIMLNGKELNIKDGETYTGTVEVYPLE
ncbi:MAG: hypothetical protein K6G40_02215 [Eubacterium sp.]|nr:hypothetical protein [Eubacterium sp.]